VEVKEDTLKIKVLVICFPEVLFLTPKRNIRHKMGVGPREKSSGLVTGGAVVGRWWHGNRCALQNDLRRGWEGKGLYNQRWVQMSHPSALC
jgi:hypothetical protein